MFSIDVAKRTAADTADQYLIEAIRSIDQRLGDGYAKKNPQLVAAFMTVAAMELQTAVRHTEGQRR